VLLFPFTASEIGLGYASLLSGSSIIEHFWSAF